MNSGIILFAHMGLSSLYPANTLIALEKALDYPVDGIEFDLHPTKDGRIVACHDDTVDRTSTGSGLIREKTFQELRELDFGIWKGPEHAGTKIPEFREILDMAQAKRPGTLLNVEIKEYEETCIRTILEELKKRSLLEQSAIISWIPEVLFLVHTLCPEIPTHGFELQEGVLPEEKSKEYYSMIRRIGFHHTRITGEIVKKYHDLGIRVDVWAPDDKETYERVAAMNVDSITTNAAHIITRVAGRI